MPWSDEPHFDPATSSSATTSGFAPESVISMCSCSTRRDQRDVSAQQLGGIGDRDDLARDRDHPGIELRFGQVGRHHAALGIEAVGAEKQTIGVQIR
jgi:hypothetical protein